MSLHVAMLPQAALPPSAQIKQKRNPKTAAAETATPAESSVFAKAALALAGHEVTDLTLRNILEQQAHGNLTGEQARAAIRKHVQG